MKLSRRLILFRVLGVLVAFTGVVVAQEPFSTSGPDFTPFQQAAGNFVFTLVVGGILLTLGKGYFDSVSEKLRREFGSSFLWGLGVLVSILGVGVLLTLFLGGIGQLLFSILLLGFVLIAIVGRVVAYLVLFGWLVDNQWLALGLTALVEAIFLVLPPFGTVVELVVASIGSGAILRNHWY